MYKYVNLLKMNCRLGTSVFLIIVDWFAAIIVDAWLIDLTWEGSNLSNADRRYGIRCSRCCQQGDSPEENSRMNNR